MSSIIGISADTLIALYSPRIASRGGPGAGTGAPKPIWERDDSPAPNQMVLDALAGKSFFDKQRAAAPEPMMGEDYKRLFAMYSGLTTLQEIAKRSMQKNVKPTELEKLQNAFRSGLNQLEDFMAKDGVEGVSLTRGGVAQGPLESKLGIRRDSNLYTTGVMHTGARSALMSKLTGNETFNIEVETAGGQRRTAVINIGKLEGQHTLSNVVALMNEQLQAAGVSTRVEAALLNPRTVERKIGTRTISVPYSGPDQWGLRVRNGSGETVAFSAEVEPALYLAGKVGTATAPGATLVKFGGGGVTGGGDPDPGPDPDPGTVPAPGTEMLTNGNFDQFADQRYGDGVSWGGYGSVTGWQSNSEALGAGQPNAIEIHQMNQSDPLYRNAIETDIGVGNSAGPDVTWQDVQTQAGRSYDLSFDYLAVGQAILSGGNSAGFEVLWNGQVVATISPTDSQWRTVNLSVTGTGGQDRLAFREMGTDDTHGSFINNVSLKAGAAVSAPAGPNLVENGSFEADNVAAGASRVVNAPQRWSSPNSGANEVIDTLGGIAGDDGAQYMELGAASVSQTLTTQAGQNYLLSFAYRDGDTGNPSEHFFDVLVNGQVKGRIDANGINQWTDQAFTFTGTGSDTITFQRVSGGAGTGVWLDNVNVQALGTSAPAYGADIVQNGSFEADNIASNSFQFLNVTGWTGRTASNGELQDGLVAGSEGAQYLELMNGGTKQSLATVAGKIYQLDFMSRYGNDGTAQSNAFQVYFGGQLVGTVNPQQGQPWSSNTMTFVGAGGTADLEFRMLPGQEGGEGALIDAVRVREVLQSAPVPPGTNIISNGSFEADDIAANSFQFLDVSGWTGITNSRGELQDGSWAAQGSQVMELMNGGTRQTINTTAGKVYELNFASHRGWDGNAASHAFEVWFNGQRIADVAPQSGEGWKNNTFTFMGAGGPANLEFRMKPGQENAQGAMIDAVSVHEVLPGTRPNLLRNGSFEADDQVAGGYTYLDAPIGWTASNPGVNEVADTWNGIPGTNGPQWIEFSSNTLSQTVTTQAGQAYTFSFDYREGDQGSGDQQRFRVRVNGQLLDQVDANGVNYWSNKSYTFIGTGNDTVQFERLSGGIDTGVWLDNAVVRAHGIDPAPPPGVGPNIVNNGSFEADNVATGGYVYLTAPSGWTASNPGVNEVADTWNGIPGTDGPQWIEFSSNALSQALSTQAGQNYTFSFDFRGGDQGSGDQQRFRVRVNGQLLDLVDANGVNSWNNKSYTFTGTGNDTIRFERLTGGVDTGVWLDNVQVRAQAASTQPAAPGANILLNGSFEGTDVATNSSAKVVQAGWTNFLGTNGGRVDTLDYSGAPNGAQYAELTETGGYVTSVQTEADRSYTLAFDFKSNSGGSVSDNQFEVWWNGQKVGDYGPTAGQGWTAASVTVSGTGAPTTLEFRTRTSTFGMSNFNGAHLDNVRLIAGPLPGSGSPPSGDVPGRTYGSNLIQDGGFEGLAGGYSSSLSTSAWQSSTGTAEVWDDYIRQINGGGPLPVAGQKYLEIDQGTELNSVWQDVNTTAGKSYQLDFSSVGRSSGGVSDSMEVLWNGTVIGTVTAAADGTWDASRFDVVGTGGVDRLTFRETVAGNDSLGPFIDNVRLREVTNAGSGGGGNWGANVVRNGSFENYGGAGGWVNNSANQTGTEVAGNWGQLADWTLNGVNGGDLVRGAGGAPLGTDGNAVVELDGASGGGVDGLSQNVTTNAGKQYRLRFDLSRYSNVTASTSDVEVVWNGQVIGTARPTGSNGQWNTAEFFVTATGSDTLQFREVGTQNDAGGALIDNVRLQENLGSGGGGGPTVTGPANVLWERGIADGKNVGAVRATATGPGGAVWVVADLTSGNKDQPIKGARDVALIKYDSGGQVAFTRMLGAADEAQGFAIDVSDDGRVAIAGSVIGGLNAPKRETLREADSFVSVFDDQGMELWTARNGARANDAAQAVTFADDGSVFVAGRTNSGIGNRAALGGEDGYLRGYSASGTELFTRQFGTNGNDRVQAIAVEQTAAGKRVTVAGQEAGQIALRQFDVGSGSSVTERGRRTIGFGEVTGLAVDDGKLYVAGNVTRASIQGTVVRAYGGGRDGFVAQVDGNIQNTSAARVSYIGTGAEDRVTGVDVANGEVFVGGDTRGALSGSRLGTRDGFAAKLADDGTLAWSRQVKGADGNFEAGGFAVDAGGASALDKLGLPTGELDLRDSRALTERSSVREGDSFEIVINGKKARTITLQRGDTLQSVASRINSALGSDGRATIRRTGDVERIRVQTERDDLVEFKAGARGRDLLGALGLNEGFLKGSSYDNKRSNEATFALRLDRGLSIGDQATAGRALKEIEDAITGLKAAYVGLKNGGTVGGSQVNAPATGYWADRAANYSEALKRLGTPNGLMGLLRA
jgi:hypothetical protein